MKFLTLATTTLVALIPSAAEASAATLPPLPVPALTDDVQVAYEFWGWWKSPQCTTETILEKELLWGGEERDTGTPLEPAPCLIYVDTIGELEGSVANLYPGEPFYVADPDEYAAKAREIRCRIVVHEVGHMLGLGHSPDPDNIMYWRISASAVVPGCEARMSETAVPTPRPRKHHRRRRSHRPRTPHASQRAV